MTRSNPAIMLACLPWLLASFIAHASDEDPRRCQAGEFEFCLDGVTSAVTSVDLIRVTGSRTADTLQKRESNEDTGIASSLNPAQQPMRGMAAGSLLDSGWSIWGSYNFSDFESSNAIAPYEGDTHGFLLGIDRLFHDRLLAGLAGGYEITQTDTFYNAGGQKTRGYTIAPYAALLINPFFSLDVSGGYSSLSNKTDRVFRDPANPARFDRLNADFDSSRWFVMSNINASYSHDNWVFGARAGLLHARETQDRYTETGGGAARTVLERQVGVTQFVTGMDIGYRFGTFEPYALINYRHDLSRSEGRNAGGLPATTGATRSDDDDEFETGLGVRYFGNQGLSGNVEWFHTVGRSQFSNHSLLLTLRMNL